MSRISRITHLPQRVALATLIGAACASHAFAAPPPPHGPPGPPPVPSTEELATIAALTPAQQGELRAALVARRDALEASEKRTRDVIDAQRDKDRAEHERIDTQTSERIRKALGDDGYRNYATWLATRGPGPGMGPRDDMGRGRGGPPNRGPGGPVDRGGPDGMRGPGPGAPADAPPPVAPPSAPPSAPAN